MLEKLGVLAVGHGRLADVIGRQHHLMLGHFVRRNAFTRLATHQKWSGWNLHHLLF
jgi:hypothetical protein